MNRRSHSGAVSSAMLINILLVVGIIIAILSLLRINQEDDAMNQSIQTYTPASPVNPVVNTPPTAENNIDSLKATLEIESLKLERLRIQTEQVRSQQRRAESVAPDSTPEIGRAPTPNSPNG